MKKSLAYYFLLFYFSAFFKPIAPIVKDSIAHCFWKMEHMATIHHHHGDDHTHVEIEKSAAQSKENPAAPKWEDPVSVHLSSQKTITFYNFLSVKKNFCTYNSVLSEFNLQLITPPPKA